LITDGIPNACGSDSEGTAAIARAAFSDRAPIPTYVIGVGPALDEVNEIAFAGGTDAAFLLGGATDLTSQLGVALKSISDCGGAPSGRR
jgi:hypothetical protein